MTESIKQHLFQLEKNQEIKILLAFESGSRAWGFPSPDSDYDVRIIYIRKHNWYLSIEDKKDTILESTSTRQGHLIIKEYCKRRVLPLCC